MTTSSVPNARPPLPAPRDGARPLRVLLVAARFFPHMGGVETHTYEVGRRLARAGVDVTVLATDPGGALPARERREGLAIRRVRSWPADRDYYFAPAIYREIVRGGWDVVNCVGYHTFVAPVAMLAARRAGIPYVVTLHSGGHSSPLRRASRSLQHAILRPLLARSARIVAVSEFERDFFRERLRLPEERFAVVANGSNLPAVRRAGRDAGALIVSVGRLEHYKGHHRVITALPLVIEQFPEARLEIVGSGPFETSLRQLAERLAIGDRVEIRSIPGCDRNAMADLLSRARLLTLLSDYESQGLAALEALAAGCPVLVSRTSALRELAVRGLARSVDAEAGPGEIASAVLEQLRNPLRPAANDLPTWDDCAQRLLALYREAAGVAMSNRGASHQAVTWR